MRSTIIIISALALLPAIAAAQTPRSTDDLDRIKLNTRPGQSLDLTPLPRQPARLDLSGITPPLGTPAQPEPTSRSFSLASPRTDSPQASGSSSIEPILRKTPSNVPPAFDKGENLLRDHRFGVEVQTPF